MTIKLSPLIAWTFAHRKSQRRRDWRSAADKAWDWFHRARWWKRHPEPFSKTNAGKLRRQNRRFKMRQREQTMVVLTQDTSMKGEIRHHD